MGSGGQSNWGQVGVTLHKVTLLCCFDFGIMHVYYLLEATKIKLRKYSRNYHGLCKICYWILMVDKHLIIYQLPIGNV